MAENEQYDHEYKVQAVKLAKEIPLSTVKCCMSADRDFINIL